MLESSRTLFPLVSVSSRFYFSKSCSGFSCLALHPRARAAGAAGTGLMGFCAALLPEIFGALNYWEDIGAWTPGAFLI